MRTSHIVVLVCTLCNYCFSQTRSIDDVTFDATDTIQGTYQPRPNFPHLFIASQFGSSRIAKTTSLDSVSGFRITEIVLVYSRYHKKVDFNQARLNDARWNNLYLLYPSLFSSGATRFYEVCQDVLTDSSAKRLTHGFYIYFENRGDSLARVEEISKLSEWMVAIGIDTSETEEAAKSAPHSSEEVFSASDSMARSAKHYSLLKTKDPKACRPAFYKEGPADLEKFFQNHVIYTNAQKRKPKELFVEVRLKLDQRGIIRNAHILTVNKQLVGQIKSALYKMEPWNPAVRDGKIIKTEVKITLYCNEKGTMALKTPVTVPVYLSKCPLTPDEEMFDFSDKPAEERTIRSAFQVEDATIVKDVVKRTKVRELLIVVDVTGSMGPYISQVVELMKELVVKNDPHVSAITFFNDGNNSPDKSKVIGRTGGISTIKDDLTLDKLGKAIIRSMKKGSGGDCMENNMEALIKGMGECPACSDVIMIADNFATPRDISLITEVKKPVHWIICGATNGLNVHYLNLVRANKGVLHTSGADVADLDLLAENQVITVDGFKYQLVRGVFKAVK